MGDNQSLVPQPNPKRNRRISRPAKLRDAMMAAVTPRDIYEITKLQIFLALKGDPLAVREVLDRTIGKPGSVADLAEAESPAADRMRRGILEQEVRAMMESIPLVSDAAQEPKPDVNSGAA